jgi:hypothetical protein
MQTSVRALLHGCPVHSCSLPLFFIECKDARMDETQEATRRFVGAILRATGWTPYRLAKETDGLSHTTISRFLNSDVTHTLSSRTLDKIRGAALKVLTTNAIDNLWLQSQRPPPPQRPRPAQQKTRG